MLMPTVKDISTVTDLRVNTIALLEKVKKEGVRMIFQRSTPKAVLLSVEKYNKLLEKLEDYEDEMWARKLLSKEKFEKGKGVSLEEIAKKNGIKL